MDTIRSIRYSRRSFYLRKDKCICGIMDYFSYSENGIFIDKMCVCGSVIFHLLCVCVRERECVCVCPLSVCLSVSLSLSFLFLVRNISVTNELAKFPLLLSI